MLKIFSSRMSLGRLVNSFARKKKTEEPQKVKIKVKQLDPKQKRALVDQQLQKMVKQQELRLMKAKERQKAFEKRFENTFSLQATDTEKVAQKAKVQTKKNYYNPFQAIHLVKLHALRSFNESVDVCLKLSADPKRGDQLLRGAAKMPGGLGKQLKFAVLAPQSVEEAIKKLGIRVITIQQLANQLTSNKISFDKLLATNEYLGQLKKFAKILGPKKLMPNPKDKTLVSEGDIVLRAKEMGEGQLYYKLDKDGCIRGSIGKIGFQQQKLAVNFQSLLEEIMSKRPATLKGRMLLGAELRSSMGPCWLLNVDQLDPKGKKYIYAGLT